MQSIETDLYQYEIQDSLCKRVIFDIQLKFHYLQGLGFFLIPIIHRLRVGIVTLHSGSVTLENHLLAPGLSFEN